MDDLNVAAAIVLCWTLNHAVESVAVATPRHQGADHLDRDSVDAQLEIASAGFELGADPAPQWSALPSFCIWCFWQLGLEVFALLHRRARVRGYAFKRCSLAHPCP